MTTGTNSHDAESAAADARHHSPRPHRQAATAGEARAHVAVGCESDESAESARITDNYDSDCASDDSIESACNSAYENEDAGEGVAVDEAIEDHINVVLNTHCCDKDCLNQNIPAATSFLRRCMSMNKDSQRVSMMTALGCCSAFAGKAQESVGRHGGRLRYDYYVPMVGKVCKLAFQAAYNASNETLTKFRGLVSRGVFSVPEHMHKGNHFARSLDEEQLVRWFKDHADTVGEVVPVRFRHRQQANGEVKLNYTKKNYVLLPSSTTWGMLHQGYIEWADEQRVRIVEPSLTSFRRILERECPTIGIRSPRDNVCDACVIYRNSMGTTPTVEQTEALVSHVEDAKSMRHKYANDRKEASSTHFVTTIDYAQNIALPHSAQTSSMWYFLSLINVSVFGIYNQPDELQWNYVYSERKAAKGSNEVISMLDSFARMRNIYSSDPGDMTWTLYADNCGGQNKNNFVIKYLMFLTHSKAVKKVTLNFLVKGHTKNHCDRGFANIKRYYARRDLWTMSMLAEAVAQSATSNKCVLLEDSQTVFRDFKSPLQRLYRDIKGIQRYQIFSMDASKPGVVSCQKRPSRAPVEMQLLATGVHADLLAADIAAVWNDFKPTKSPPINKEKIVDMFKKVVPYVPEALRSDPLYIVPTFDDASQVRVTKRARRYKKTPRLTPDLIAARQNQS